MDQHPTPDSGAQHEVPEFCGSAWAVLDESFFRLTQDIFSHTFCRGASTLLASNDDGPPRVSPPSVITLPDQPLSDQATARRAAMYRHPSARRRF
jgi:hypothetical protein